MTWVKICGITNLEDALVAVDAGADALGFVFYEKSPRKVDSERAREIVDKLPKHVEKVGVFVDQSAEQIETIARMANLTAIQVYGVGDSARLKTLRRQGSILRFILAVPGDRLDGDSVFLGLGNRNGWIDAILLDSTSATAPGGTGKKFDWSATQGWARAINSIVPVIVAGGLTPENVGEAIEAFRSYGVDVSSGVEAKLGKKDPKKVRTFVQAVREADRNGG